MNNFQQKYEGGFANNFDMVRLVLATSVVFLHFDHLLNQAAASEILQYTEWLSSRAVPAFFVVSGFVVYMSFERDQDLMKYTVSRFLRLYPAYFVVVTVVALLPLISTTCVSTGMFTPTWWRYLVVNLGFANFLQPTLPCVFDANFDQALNGSLWTLKIEVMFYATVPILYHLICRFGGLSILIGIFILSLIYYSGMMALFNSTGSGIYRTLANQLPGQMSYFSIGILLYLYYGHFYRHWKWLVVAGVVLLFLPVLSAEPIALGIITIAAATVAKKHIDLTKVGDLSYGIYILHFPIIQLSLQLGLFEGQWVLHFVAILFATFVAAFLSSRLIEIPAMRLKKKLTGKRSPALAS